MITISDPVRPEAAAAIADLRARDIEAWLLTGDNRLVAESVAAAVGIPADHVIADVLPAEKQQRIKELGRGRRVGRWSATASTTLRRWPRRTSASP